MLTLADVMSTVLIRILYVRLIAALKFPLQSFLEVQATLDLSVSALLGLQLGVVVRKFIEQDGDGHSI